MPPLSIFRPLTRLYTDVAEDAAVSADYRNNKKMRPIFFSHGIRLAPNMYTCLFSELASRGYIVFAPYHMDTSCAYT